MEFMHFLKESVKEDVITESIENKISDAPAVVFQNLEMAVYVGQWLGILPLHEKASQPSGNTIHAGDLLRRHVITDKVYYTIAEKFGLLLKQAGIASDECCILNFNKGCLSYAFVLSNGSDVNIILHLLGKERKLEITNSGESRLYEYDKDGKSNKEALTLKLRIFQNDQNGNIYYCTSSNDVYYFQIDNDDRRFVLKIKKPDNTKVDEVLDEDSRSKKEKMLGIYLERLTFPIQICEVYKQICAIFMEDIALYPRFALEVRNVNASVNCVNEELITLRYGLLDSILITRNEKTVRADSRGNWLYKTPEVSITQYGDLSKKVVYRDLYGSCAMGSDEVEGLIDTAKKEVNAVKNFVMQQKK